jgi:hypothetical protein
VLNTFQTFIWSLWNFITIFSRRVTAAIPNRDSKFKNVVTDRRLIPMFFADQNSLLALIGLENAYSGLKIGGFEPLNN